MASPGTGAQGALVTLRTLGGHPSAALGRAQRGPGAAEGAALVQEAGKTLDLELILGEHLKSRTVLDII